MYNERKILQVYNRKKVKVSYGVVLYNTTTDKYLAIRKRCTYAYSKILSGLYKDINQDNLLSQITVKEAIKIILNTGNIISFIKILEDANIQYNSYTLDLALNKIKTGNVVKKCKRLLLDGVLYKDIQLTWPKGNKNKRESNLDCALRELKEETSIDINTINYTIKGECICSCFKSEDLIEYRIKVFIIHTPDIIDIKEEYDKDEVREILWVDIDYFKANCYDGYLHHIDKYT